MGVWAVLYCHPAPPLGHQHLNSSRIVINRLLFKTNPDTWYGMKEINQYIYMIKRIDIFVCVFWLWLDCVENFYNLQFLSDIWHISCCYVLPDEKIILVFLFKEACWSMRPINSKSNHFTGLTNYFLSCLNTCECTQHQPWIVLSPPWKNNWTRWSILGSNTVTVRHSLIAFLVLLGCSQSALWVLL